jgi:HIRAN domain
VVDVSFDEKYWYPEDGGVVWLSGFQLVEPGSGRYLARDAPELRARGIRVAAVAGAGAHHPEAVASADVAPGRPLSLRRDAANPHDPNAIAVHAEGGEQVGWVPRELAAELAPLMDEGQRWSVLSLRESRASPRDPRTGLTMILAQAESIDLREV